MLHNTFIHIPGIGEKTEKLIWQSGIQTWDQWHPPFPPNLTQAKINLITYHLEHYIKQQDGSASFYAKLLQPAHQWRLFPHFRDRTAFLDIETNGLGLDQCEITTIALYDGRTIRTYVQGRNLKQFIRDINDYEVIVTYSGKNFDVPVIESYLHTRLKHVHIDLRYILARLGYRGGLKGCERQLGINRMEMDGVDGYWAVLLWQEFASSGNDRALQTLLAYNIADAVNLEPLLVHAYNLNIAHTPFALSNYIPLPESPAPDFYPDKEILLKIREMIHYPYK
ncbi:MAG: ribonuclease H-like domain-containing protein [Proteobacteria bacterium]|nr:ribonuclease H-like domain-containing protein [Pseudomonadota bacterium]MBU4297267.1 ribonuclease H-like domain-containing protein [Pseudomonadota bacterium]MCG2747718.1 ribonuclease H-like domain-containing protein [Desulfobulbaceae bacterium]